MTRGGDILNNFRGTNIPIAGFMGAAKEYELIPLLWAATEPAGYVQQAAFDAIAGEMTERLAAAGPVDAVYLDLHGAMVTEEFEDGEGELLRRVRAVVGPDMPVVVSLDLHANLTPAFADLATAVAIFRTYPHVDMAETGARAARLADSLLRSGAAFAKAFRQLDYLIPITAQSTRREPGGRLYGMLDGLAGAGVASVDFAFGFPPADIRDCGASVVAYGTDQVAVDAAADAMVAAVAGAEAEFVDPMIPAQEAVANAIKLAALSSKPVVICDPQDNPGAGAPGDATGLLRALIEHPTEAASLGMFWDPDAAAAAHVAGVGATLDLTLGGRFPESGGPGLKVRATVEALSDGVFRYTGPMFGGAQAHLGPMARLKILDKPGDVSVVIATNRAQNADQAVFRAVGVEPTEQKILAVKSAVHFLADYEPIAQQVIFAEAPGANPCRLTRIPFTRLRSGVRLGPNGPAFQTSDAS